MKKVKFLSIIILSLIISISSFSQNKNLEGDLTVSLPSNSQDHWYGAMGGQVYQWFNPLNSVYIYDTLGNMTKRLRLTRSSASNWDQWLYKYDKEKRLVETIKQTWDTQYLDWYNVDKSSTTYDANGNVIDYFEGLPWSFMWYPTYKSYKYQYTYDINKNVTSKIHQYYDTNTSKYTLDLKSEYTYNNNLLSEIINYNYKNNVWNKESRETFTVNTNGYTEHLLEKWDGSNWINDDKLTNITWNNYSKEQKSSYTQQVWTNNAWQDSLKVSFVYDQNDGYVETALVYQNSNWISNYKYTYSVDSKKNFRGQKFELYNGSKYVREWEERINLIYDPWNNITTKCIAYYDKTKMYGGDSLIYSNFKQYIVGVNKNDIASAFAIYPNPAKDVLNISGIRKVESYKIFDIAGKEVISSKSNSINISILEKGIYFVRVVTNDNKTYNSKFIKE